MSYVRPAQVSGSGFTLVIAQGFFPGSGVERYGPFGVTSFNIGRKAIYVAVWDDRTFRSSPWSVRHFPVIYHKRDGSQQASSIQALTSPDQSTIVGPYSVTNDFAAYQAALLSGNQQVFFDEEAVGGNWPGSASVEFLGQSSSAQDFSRSETSTQEVFAWTPSPSDPGGGDRDPQDCGPVPRPPWPYGGAIDIDLRSSGKRPLRRRSSGQRQGLIELSS